jgi:two-component system, chemotaxis family, protein-glutamate methylesterase/glutaminase
VSHAAVNLKPVNGIRSSSNTPIRVMIIDDSIIARSVFDRLIGEVDDLEIVASLPSAKHAIETLQSERVDVILLDLEMPEMGGLEALPLIIGAARGAPILVVSSSTKDGAEQTIAALALGAADTLGKPESGHFKGAYPAALLSKIRALRRTNARAIRPVTLQSDQPLVQPAWSVRPSVLAIGSSTGGIHALGILLDALPQLCGLPILITQHLPDNFMPIFARQLTASTGYAARVAEEGAELLPNQILVAPGHAHLTVTKQAGTLRVKLDTTTTANGFMPSVDPMFASIAEILGSRALGVVLSGMGRDGAEGAARIVQMGGTILAQDEASSSVWGMPRAVAQAGLASAILPPDRLGECIAFKLGGKSCN